MLRALGATFMMVLAMILVLSAVMFTRLWRVTTPDVPSSASLSAVPLPAVPLDIAAMSDRLSQGIQVVTISHLPAEPDDEQAIVRLHEVLRRSFPAVFAQLKVETFPGGSLLMTWAGSDASLRPIMLTAHQDVVPVSPGTETDWSQPPFSGAIHDGFIWGRGTLDDKSSLFGLMETIDFMLRQGVQPRRGIILAFGHNEEVGGSGAKAMALELQTRGVRLEYLLDEGGVVTEQIVGGVKPAAAMIGVTEKGFVSVQLTSEDPGGHSSMPGVTTNIGRLARAIHRIEENPEPLRIGPTMEASLKSLAPGMGFTSQLAIANLWLFSPLVARSIGSTNSGRASLHTTRAATVFNAGIKDNVLPGRATATINLRLIAGDSVAHAIERLAAVIDDPAVKITPNLEVAKEPAPESDPEAPSFKQVAATVREIFPDALVAPYTTVGATDSVAYKQLTDNIYRFLPIRWRPEDQSRFHGSNERIAVDAYADLVRFYIQLVNKTAM